MKENLFNYIYLNLISFLGNKNKEKKKKTKLNFRGRWKKKITFSYIILNIYLVDQTKSFFKAFSLHSRFF